jgi:beta-lactamase class A
MGESRKYSKNPRASNSYLIYAGFFLVGILIGLVGTKSFFSSESKTYFTQIGNLQKNQNTFSYLRPFIGVDAPNALTIGQYAPLYSRLNNMLEDDKANGDVMRYSVYFRDLNNGLWIGLNENDKYNPASLLKIASAITVYKEAEANPTFLKRSVEYTEAMLHYNSLITGASPSELKVGESYSVENLIKILLIKSDNGAKDALVSVIDNDMLYEVFKDLGLPDPQKTDDYKISSRDYSLFFRMLYNASYLSRNYSEEILKTLTGADFTSGLVAGVPQDTKVSHKYGEYMSFNNDSSVKSLELHDCGIVYHPAHPYIVCVMTEGTDEGKLKDVIKDVSQVIYSSVDSNYQK